MTKHDTINLKIRELNQKIAAIAAEIEKLKTLESMSHFEVKTLTLDAAKAYEEYLDTLVCRAYVADSAE